MRKSFYLLAAIVVAMTTASCLRPHYNVADLMCADAENAAVINIAELAAAAGVDIARDGSLKYPADFVASLSPQALSEMEATNEALRQSGIALGSVGVYKPNDEEAPVYVLNFKDYDRFVKFILDKGYEKRLGQFGIMTFIDPDRPETLLATKGDAVQVIDITGDDAGPDAAWHYFYYIGGDNCLALHHPESPLSIGNPADIAKLPSSFRTILSVNKPTPQDILLFAQDIIGLITTPVHQPSEE